ncbi:MAG: signal recognition particle subunit SRP54 [Bacteroidia bacterium]|jgi:signal recognition particle subunit SRP54|tara:strand:+ start:690 stop:2012 length:1323 start_codon:yes stop_codon:yes gene_type:complete
MFDNLSTKLDRAFKTLKGQSSLTELNIAETVKDIRRALVDADVSYNIAKDFTNKIKEEALGQNVLTSVSPSQLMTKIVNDELKELLGGETAPINITGSPAVILIAGLQGSGKTTFSGKLSAHLKSKGKNPLLVACDVYRPAAINQIRVLGEQVGVSVFANEENKNPVAIAKEAIVFAKANNHNVVIVDTAGRLSVDEAMMAEIGNLKGELKPQEILFVVDAMTGQDAVNTAKAFNDKLDFDGVVLTKLDGDTRGGAALSIKSVVNKPIKFVSTGEKMDALDVFHPDRMANRILGMGDIVSFVERAQSTFDEQESAELQKKMRKNQFDFDDFLKQLNQIKKMGNIKDLMGMIPGVGKAIKDVDIDEDSFKGIEAIIHSMTSEERQNPQVLNGSRKDRIAKGSGTSTAEVNKLVKQFDEMKKMMKMMNAGGGKRPGKKLFKR